MRVLKPKRQRQRAWLAPEGVDCGLRISIRRKEGRWVETRPGQRREFVPCYRCNPRSPLTFEETIDHRIILDENTRFSREGTSRPNPNVQTRMPGFLSSVHIRNTGRGKHFDQPQRRDQPVVRRK